MKVRELIEELSKVDGERLVVLQKDPEGNGYSPLAGVDANCAYSTNCHEVYMETLTDELCNEGFSVEDTADGRDAVPAFVLFPVR